jgi:hypothetical protein
MSKDRLTFAAMRLGLPGLPTMRAGSRRQRRAGHPPSRARTGRGPGRSSRLAPLVSRRRHHRGLRPGVRLTDRHAARGNPRPDVPPADVHHRRFGGNRLRAVSGLCQSPKDLPNDPGRLSPQTPRLWRRARRACPAKPRATTRFFAGPRPMAQSNFGPAVEQRGRGSHVLLAHAARSLSRRASSTTANVALVP